EILDLAGKADGKVGQIYVMDASRRTAAANAYVNGLGGTKRVVVYDTLLDRFSPRAVRGVVAHELGHVHYRDVPRGLLYLLIVAPVGMFAVQSLSEALRGRRRVGRLAYASLRPRAGPRVPAPRILPALALSLGLMSGAITIVS